MGRRKMSSIKITEIYQAGTCKINVHDEAHGNSLSETITYPKLIGEKDIVKAKLIERIKEMAHAKSNRHSETSMPAPERSPAVA